MFPYETDRMTGLFFLFHGFGYDEFTKVMEVRHK